ncbi:hypothetical protein SR41_02780 [Sphingomonas melonis]|uniref:Uncharacterized protein n=1 Tax=Sphingomonas melonis TaxID=152682 RepID=A0A0D1MBC0_9SPHN|nr:hypothetical protein SR41_02780 [Sphingomonas melonis]
MKAASRRQPDPPVGIETLRWLPISEGAGEVAGGRHPRGLCGKRVTTASAARDAKNFVARPVGGRVRRP